MPQPSSDPRRLSSLTDPEREWAAGAVGLLADEPLEAMPGGSGIAWCSRLVGCIGAITLGCCCRLSRAKGEGAEASAASAPLPPEAVEGEDHVPPAPAPPLANRLCEAAAAQTGSSATAAATAAASAWVLEEESLRQPSEPKAEPSAEARPLAAPAGAAISVYRKSD